MTTPTRPGTTGAYREDRRRRGGAWLWWLLGLLLLAIVIAIIVILLATNHSKKSTTPAAVGTTAPASPTPVTPAAGASPAALVGGGGIAVKTATGAEAAKGVLGTVLFPTDSAALDAGDEQVIAAAATALKADGATAVVVGGYTDNTSTTSTNTPLSGQRATTVAAKLRALLGAGVSVTTVDHGETGPVAPNSTPAGQAQNRRAVISTNS